MKTGTKTIALGLTLAVLANTPAMAETHAWFQKIKNFFSGTPATTEATVEESATATAEPTQKEPERPVFDFSDKTIGNPKAPLKIRIFTSLTCPHCPTAHTQLLPYLKKNYADKNEALIYMVDFPLEPHAFTASMISLCLTGDTYFAFMETLFENQRHWAAAPELQEALLPYAKLAGLNKEKMLACATDESAIKEMTRQRNLNIMRYKIRATPTIIMQLGKETKTFEGVPANSDIDAAIKELKASYTGKWPSDEPEKPTSTLSAP